VTVAGQRPTFKLARHYDPALCLNIVPFVSHKERKEKEGKKRAARGGILFSLRETDCTGAKVRGNDGIVRRYRNPVSVTQLDCTTKFQDLVLIGQF
jgi:hypothetical protein